ncbi:MAG: hypothetical protein AB2A00_24860 [Myxococcota bacterium]
MAIEVILDAGVGRIVRRDISLKVDDSLFKVPAGMPERGEYRRRKG